MVEVKELDAVAKSELSKIFPDASSLPKGFDAIFFTGFKESQNSAEVAGQIIARPDGWDALVPDTNWYYAGVALFPQDAGGIYYKGMSFPMPPEATEGKFELPTKVDELVRRKIKIASEKLKLMIAHDAAAKLTA